MKHIYIHPGSRVLYASFYIEGLYRVFGRQNVSFSMKYFTTLERNDINAYEQYFPYVIVEFKETKRVVIDFHDNCEINEMAYEWCDVYAKINFDSNLSTYDKYKNKLKQIPPGFGIRVWNIYQTIYYAIANSIKLKFKTLVKLKTFWGGYKRQFERSRLSSYSNSKISESDDEYVFLIGTIWDQIYCVENTNLLRKVFVDECVNQQCKFEGGFSCLDNHPQYELFHDHLLKSRYKINEYIDRTKKSVFVFNTPAVWGCHGWKLPEYFAMGKAIISTPFIYTMPINLVHKRHIYFINDENELTNAIQFLVQNKELRTELGLAAYDYWKKYLTPEAVINSIY